LSVHFFLSRTVKAASAVGLNSSGIDLAAGGTTTCSVVARARGEHASSEALVSDVWRSLGSHDIVDEQLGRGVVARVDGEATS